MGMGTMQSLQTFLRANKLGWQFAWKAHEDYLLTRTGLLSGLWSSCEMGTQTVEKLLKAFLLMSDKSFNQNENTLYNAVRNEAKNRGRTREYGHDVETLLDMATARGMSVGPNVSSQAIRINELYERRYPDHGPKKVSTSDLNDIDNVVFEVWDNFRLLNQDYYYVTGIANPMYCYASDIRCGKASSLAELHVKILKEQNQALAARIADLEKGISERLDSWYPSQ